MWNNLPPDVLLAGPFGVRLIPEEWGYGVYWLVALPPWFGGPLMPYLSNEKAVMFSLSDVKLERDETPLWSALRRNAKPI